MSVVNTRVIAAEQSTLDGPYPGKRAVDVFILGLVAVPALIIGLACALAVRLTSRGPVFFRQERAGLGGAPFRIWKFRTMTHGDNPIFPEDCHITKVGAVLRRLSLDELPQLINVATGDMSIVGPRPTMLYQVKRYNDFQRRRLLVKPGLTGLAQVSGRNSISWGSRIEHDVRYVKAQSVRLDCGLVFRTITTILSGHGVEGHQVDDPLAAPPSSEEAAAVTAATTGIENAVELRLIDLTETDSADLPEITQPSEDDLVIDLRPARILDQHDGILSEEQLETEAPLAESGAVLGR